MDPDCDRTPFDRAPIEVGRVGPTRIGFTKAAGLGNDYIFVDGRRFEVPQPSEAVRRWSRRHTGLGSDGLIVISNDLSAGDGVDAAACRMHMFNADGSRAEMCGNGLRCVAWLAREWGFTDRERFGIETDSGRLEVEAVETGPTGGLIRTQVGTARVEPDRTVDVPGRPSGLDGPVRGTVVDIGNPHFVVEVDDVDTAPVEQLGSRLENAPEFPDRTNVPFVSVTDRGNLRIRVWERGAGETLACGTGAAATFAALFSRNRVDDRVTAHLRGGPLELSMDDRGVVWQCGPATWICDGEVGLP